MTLSELAHAVHKKHGDCVGWVYWVVWARRSVGWMRTM
jgi:hypothetical protein